MIKKLTINTYVFVIGRENEVENKNILKTSHFSALTAIF